MIHITAVLSSRKDESINKKGKDYANAKWEAELRKTLNSKASTSTTLSKQDQALVQEQLQKESQIRKRIMSMKTRLEHGLELVHSLASARVDEFRLYLSELATLLLKSGFGNVSLLTGTKAFDTFLVSSLSTSHIFPSHVFFFSGIGRALF